MRTCSALSCLFQGIESFELCDLQSKGIVLYEYSREIVNRNLIFGRSCISNSSYMFF